MAIMLRRSHGQCMTFKTTFTKISFLLLFLSCRQSSYYQYNYFVFELILIYLNGDIIDDSAVVDCSKSLRGIIVHCQIINVCFYQLWFQCLSVCVCNRHENFWCRQKLKLILCRSSKIRTSKCCVNILEMITIEQFVSCWRTISKQHVVSNYIISGPLLRSFKIVNSYLVFSIW